MDQFLFNYPFPVNIDEAKTEQWLAHVSDSEGFTIQQLSFTFLSDTALRALNKEYLQHDYFTDVITFDNSFDQGVYGDIMISAEMVTENAKRFNTSVSDELDRVMVHGLLHLLGYKDGSAEEKAAIRAKEDHYLNLRPV